MAGEKILIADDEPHVRKLLERYLSHHGYVVGLAADGLEALELVRQQTPDLVITDVNMPNMNGFELLAEVKKDEGLKHIPVLMVTAEARKEDIVRAAQDGAAGYIVKPFTKATLEEKVQKIMQKMTAAA